MINTTNFFLREHAKQDLPLLLGLSGGPDSMALFHLLLQLREEGWYFGVAHVNHNWREPSVQEAKKLQEMAFFANVPFHLLSLDPKNMKGNLELECRLERLKFFHSLCDQFNYQATLLAHHLDDKAETVLKRLFEGASLTRLYGLKPVSVIEGVKILRPLLHFQKSEILEWLKEQQISFFQDSTNEDPKFIRGRFRTKIIPYLNLEFGKNIGNPLVRLGVASLELDDYLKQRMAPYLQQVVKTPLGAYLDFSRVQHPFEIKYLIKEFTATAKFYLSFPLIEKVVKWLQENAVNKCISMSGKTIFIDRKKMFIISPFMQNFLKNKPDVSLQLDTANLGVFKMGPWRVELLQNESNQVDLITSVLGFSPAIQVFFLRFLHFFSQKGGKPSFSKKNAKLIKKNSLNFKEINPKLRLIGWRQAFHGFTEISIPEGKYCLTSSRDFSKINAAFSASKVPSFLRTSMPVLIKDGKFYKELLTEERSFSKQLKYNTFKLLITLDGIGVDDEKKIC